jgi:hypothetical protein
MAKNARKSSHLAGGGLQIGDFRPKRACAVQPNGFHFVEVPSKGASDGG